MDETQHEFLAQVASLYYERGLTQDDVARQLGLSRVKVYRLLKQAREEQVVQITIHWPVKRDAPLEDALKQHFGLKDAVVLQTSPQAGSPALRRLGYLGARYLERTLKDGMTLAVCLGRSTYEVIDAIRPDFQVRVRVAQALGSIPFATRELDGAALARQLAQRLGGDVLYLSSPIMADSGAAAGVLRSQQGIETTLRAARSADVALVGIGNLDPVTSGLVQAGFVTREEMTALVAGGAVGDIAGQIFSLDGKLYPCEYNQRVIGITFEELCAIPTTIAVAMGLEKARAILGCLRTCAIKVLCTDDRTASEVLKSDRG